MLDTTVKPSLGSYLAHLWRYYGLLYYLIVRDVKGQTKQSLLGFLWILLPPIFQMGIFSLLFRVILDLPMTEKVPYPVFLYCTALPWQMFVGMMAQGTAAVVSHGGLIKQVYFPKEVIVLSAMLAEVLKTLISSVILVALMVYYHIGVGINILYLPVLFVIQLCFSLGLVLPLTALNAFARDISKGLGIALSIWMYVTPVVYPLEKVPAVYRDLYLLNPMAVIIQGYREVILENSPPQLLGMLWVTAVSLAMFLAGVYIFKKFEGLLADVI